MLAPNITRRQYQQRALRAAKRRAAQLGYQLVPMPDAGDLRTTYAPHGSEANRPRDNVSVSP